MLYPPFLYCNNHPSLSIDSKLRYGYNYKYSGFVGESTPDSIIEVTLVDHEGNIKHYSEGDPRIKVDQEEDRGPRALFGVFKLSIPPFFSLSLSRPLFLLFLVLGPRGVSRHVRYHSGGDSAL